MKTQKVKVEQLKSNPKNPRIIKDEKFKKLVKSIKDFPKMLEIRPIVVDSDMIVLGGNMRLKACIQAGLKEVPVICADDLTEDEKKEFVIKDNLGFGEWNWDDLANDWDALKLEEWGMDLPEESFEKVEGLTDEDAVPEVPKEPITVLGDVWQLGNHRLMCGDSTSIDSVDKLMAGQKADMVFTDPPYGMFLDADYSGMKSKFKGSNGGAKYENVIGDHEDFNPDFINNVFASFGYCKEIFLWGADYYADLLPNRNDGSWVVWDKRGDESADKMFGSTFELCWSKARHKRMLARIKWAGIFGMEKEHDKKRCHPTQKPVELINWFFDYYSMQDKKIVVDLFGGSGSTLIACEKTNRHARLMELDPKYCDVIIKRWQDFTGKKAVLL